MLDRTSFASVSRWCCRPPSSGRRGCARACGLCQKLQQRPATQAHSGSSCSSERLDMFDVRRNSVVPIPLEPSAGEALGALALSPTEGLSAQC